MRIAVGSSCLTHLPRYSMLVKEEGDSNILLRKGRKTLATHVNLKFKHSTWRKLSQTPNEKIGNRPLPDPRR